MSYTTDQESETSNHYVQRKSTEKIPTELVKDFGTLQKVNSLQNNYEFKGLPKMIVSEMVS